MCRPDKKQAGAVLMVMLFIISLLLTALTIESISTTKIQLERIQKTQHALMEAKSALMGRAILDENRPGSLPCPDSDNDGSAELFHGNRCPSYIGRFPWRTLGIPKLQDADGETLWYVLSTNYRDHSAIMPLNSNSQGLLSVDAQNDIVAIIFAVGSPLAKQTGRPSDNLTDYLEGNNADADNAYTAISTSTQNDRLLAITRNELMRQVERRILREIASSLQLYFSNPSHTYYPYAATANGTCESAGSVSGFIPIPHETNCPATTLPVIKEWFVDNDWGSLLQYEIASACSKTSPNCSGSGFITDGAIENVRVRLTFINSNQKRIIY